MEADHLSIYPTWDLTLPTLPVRSVLYPLQPVGVGTPDVESLTSYLARLATVHGVSTRVLLVEAVIPLVGRSDLSKVTDNSLSAFWTTDSRALNGTGTIARVWTQAVATLTERTDLPHLTLLTWRDVFPARGLLRRVRAWCPACYEEWRQQDAIIYDPLRWALAVVTACLRHRRPLRQVCPHPTCRQSLPSLASHATPGHCPSCGGWLGTSAETGEEEGEVLGVEVLAWQCWVDTAVGDLLATSPMAAPPGRERVTSLIARCVAPTGGSTAFARAMQLKHETVWSWTRGTQLPSLGALLALGYRLDLSLRDILLADPGQITGRPIRPHPPAAAPVPTRRRKRFETDRVRAALADVLQRAEEPPPSMREVARRLGYDHVDLSGRFPDLCHAISARYLAHCRTLGEQRMQRLCCEVREATFRIHAQGHYPSSVRVASLLTHPSHFRHPTANAAWHAALCDLGWEQ